MKNTILLLIFIFVSCNSTSKLTSEKIKVNKEGFIEFENFGIRDKPILNREYILLLAWYIDVYGFCYPEKIMSMLPETNRDLPTIQKNDFKQISQNPKYLFKRINHSKKVLENLSSFLKEYVFNPIYIDYPVIGLSNNQVLEMQKWMNDRYNENKLIEVGYLNFNPMQMDEDSFETVSYILGQYQGNVRNDKKINWEEGEFKSNFRLPYSEELELAGINK